MPYVPADVVKKASEMDLLTYLQNYEPNELIKVSASAYSTKTHGSMNISNGMWYWHSGGFGGVSALSYLTKVRGMYLPHAVEQVLGKAAVVPPVFVTQKIKERKEFLLPKQNGTVYRMVQYLQSRGIDLAVIKHCYDLGILYESQGYGNAVFVGKDEAGIAAYAHLRGHKFMGEVEGSQKKYSFSVPAAKPSSTVHLFESPIDLLSYATLEKRRGQKPWQDNLLSLAGVSRFSTHLPVALEHYLTQFSHTKTVICRLDNDETGQKAAERIKELLAGRCEVSSVPPPKGKDYNEYLCQIVQKQKIRKQECVR